MRGEERKKGEREQVSKILFLFLFFFFSFLPTLLLPVFSLFLGASWT
jgi:hypothetical protein